MNFLSNIRNFFKAINAEIKKYDSSPAYKLVEIQQDANENYHVVIQVVNKNAIFSAKPEELLADDKMVDQFSQRDIRAMTYLGYLGMNAPKYKILAKKLMQENDKFVFAIQRRGDNEIISKTAEEILQQGDILGSMCPDDAKTIGYAVAEEDLREEKRAKEMLKNSVVENKELGG